MNRWNERFAKTTRGRILALLRAGPRTVDELAAALDRTDNAVRAHLMALETDGLVRTGGMRRAAAGKPPQSYALTPEAQQLFFSSACAPFLTQVLHAAGTRLGKKDLTALMHSVGEGMAADHVRPVGGARARVEAVARVLDALGGVTTVENGDGPLVIRGLSCPLGALVESHPEVCEAIESFAATLTGMAVRERCLRDQGPPRCALEFTSPAPARSASRGRRRT